MSDRDIIDTIADDFNCEIVGHSSDYNGGRLTYSRSRDLAQQAIFALRSAGYAIVALPEHPEHPAKVLIGGEPESVYVNDRDEASTNEPSITISGTVSIYADEAAPLAAALLAAAEKAEEK